MSPNWLEGQTVAACVIGLLLSCLISLHEEESKALQTLCRVDFYR